MKTEGKGVFMPKLNGTFLGLHGPGEELYYHPLEFRDRVDLSGYFHGGNPPYSDSYLAEPGQWEEILGRLAVVGVLGKLFFNESNSAHNLSYFLARAAYEQLGGAPKFLILNFDQHEDYEGVGKGLLCSNWGVYICRQLRCDYLIVGRRTKKDALLIPYADGAKPKRIAKVLNRLSDLQGLVAGYEKIYLTVDMDVMKGTSQNVKRTNWQHGDIPADTLLEWLGTLPPEKVIAGDITGFPPMAKQNGRPFSREELEIWDTYIGDLEKVAQGLCAVMGIAPYVG